MSKMSKMSIPHQELKLFTRTHSQSENENHKIRNHLHPFFQLLLINPSNHSIALQVNSGTFGEVMLHLPRFTSFCTSNRLKIRLKPFRPSESKVSRKLERIHSDICKPFLPSASEVSRKCERVHSDICGPFPTSKDLTKLLLTFLDDYSHWCWIATIDDTLPSIANFESSSNESRQKLS
jgi:hypothetical protein